MSEILKKLNEFSGFNPAQRALLDLFGQLDIAHDTYSHPPIFTVEAGNELGLHTLIPGQGGKSLLLTNQTGGLWLVVAADTTRVDLKSLSVKLETKRFSFAKPEIMLETLGVTPGSATPFALMHDAQHRITVVLDEEFMKSARCVFHPLQNTYSTVIDVADLVRFIKHLGYTPIILPLA